ncbi:hypothetical protein BgiMline_008386 [Biomphalaria glabrata]
MTRDEVIGDELTVDEVIGDELTVDKVIGDELTVDEVIGNELTRGEGIGDVLTMDFSMLHSDLISSSILEKTSCERTNSSQLASVYNMRGQGECPVQSIQYGALVRSIVFDFTNSCASPA